MRAEVGAHAPQIFFDLAAVARCGAGAHDRRRHSGEARIALRDDGIAAAEEKLRGDFRERFGSRPAPPACRSQSVRTVRFGQATGRSGPSAGALVSAEYAAATVRICGGHGVISSAAGRRISTARFVGTRNLLRGGLRFRWSDVEKAVENRVHAVRIAIEQREAREIMHQAEARHVRAHSAFEHRVIIGAEFHFYRVEFVFGDWASSRTPRITSS